jgi:hypothetical protein
MADYFIFNSLFIIYNFQIKINYRNLKNIKIKELLIQQSDI